MITIWHIVGFVGTGLFSARWFVQIWQSRKAGKPVVSKNFWYLSIAGSFFLLAYFLFGNPDLVGIVSNIFPIGIAGYNLFLLFSTDNKIK